MHPNEKLTEFLSKTAESIQENKFIKLSLGNYKGQESGLKNIYIKRVAVKKQEKLSFTYRYKTRDIYKNHDFPEAIQLLTDWVGKDFHIATLQTADTEIQFEILKNGKQVVRKNSHAQQIVPSAQHDKVKNRLIAPEGKIYLQQLGITDDQGNVLKNAQDKYRQINHYIEILSGLIREIPETDKLTVADMGSGKGYLTFALYDYLLKVKQVGAEVTGVEFRSDLVALCNQIAAQSEFSGLHFREGTIEDYAPGDLDMLIALHACDTATDDAILKGIRANAGLIVVAPCCHKQIRREIEKNKADNDVKFLTRYGIFLERQAEMVTDGIRALVLEYFGYKTKVFEFISDAHTAKNVMIVGIKGSPSEAVRRESLKKIREAKEYFGISYHHLERIAGI